MDSRPAERLIQDSAAPAGTHGAAPAAREADPSSDLLATLQRIDHTLDQLHGRLETLTRAQRHREFSAARLVGVILQILVLALVFVAAMGWTYGAKEGRLLVELAFAAVLQLGTLTAFVVSRDRG